MSCSILYSIWISIYIYIISIPKYLVSKHQEIHVLPLQHKSLIPGLLKRALYCPWMIAASTWVALPQYTSVANHRSRTSGIMKVHKTWSLHEIIWKTSYSLDPFFFETYLKLCTCIELYLNFLLNPQLLKTWKQLFGVSIFGNVLKWFSPRPCSSHMALKRQVQGTFFFGEGRVVVVNKAPNRRNQKNNHDS